MTNDDIDQPEDFDKDDISDRPSLRELWESSPMLKLGAIVLGVGILTATTRPCRRRRVAKSLASSA